MFWRWRVGLLGAVLVTVTGCTSVVTGSAVPDPGYTPPPPAPTDTLAALVKDPTTLDPCSLLKPSAVQQYGAVTEAPSESFDYCRFDLIPTSTPAGKVTLRFGDLGQLKRESDMRPRAQEVAKPGKLLRVFQHEEQATDCSRTVLFSDLATMSVTADTFEIPTAVVQGLCTIVERATAEVVRTLERGDAARYVTHPPGSFGGLDPCELASDRTVASPMIRASEKTTYPGRHHCRWGDAPGTPRPASVSVRFAKGAPSSGDPQVIAGKQSMIFALDSGLSLCLAEYAKGSELAQVTVRLPTGQRDQACAKAKQVAEEVWPKLPG